MQPAAEKPAPTAKPKKKPYVDETRAYYQAIDTVPLIERQRGILEEQAKARMEATQIKKGSNRVVIESRQPEKGKVADALAKQAGVSQRTYYQLKKVTEQGTPELATAVREKAISAENAAIIASLPKEKQNEQIPLLDRQLVTA